MKKHSAIYIQIKGFEIQIRTDTPIPYEQRKSYRDNLESKAVYHEDLPIEDITDMLISVDPGIYYVHFSVYVGGPERIDTIFEK